MTAGELFIVAFVTIAVVSAPWWGRVGAFIGRRLAERSQRRSRDGHD